MYTGVRKHKYFLEITLGWFTFGGGWYSGEGPVLLTIGFMERFYSGSWSLFDFKALYCSLFVLVDFGTDDWEDEYIWLPLETE